MTGLLRLPIALALALALWLPAPSFAQAPSGDHKQATELFEQGGKLFLDKRYDEALSLLEKSYQLYPSPNSLLLIARCERDLGRLEVAVGHFAETASAADAHVTAGEAQYKKTAESARSEGASVRAMLGTLRVHVKDAPSGTLAETEYTRALVGSDGSAELPHRAGSAKLVVRAPNGRAIEKTVRVSARAWTDVDVAFANAGPASEQPAAEPTPGPNPTLSPTPSGPPPAPEPEKTGGAGWMLPTGAVLTGIGAVGLGSFAYFGLKSRSTYDDLKLECGGSCNTQAQHDEADRGKQQQTIANLSLVVGGVALAAGVTLIVIAVSNGSSSKKESAARHTIQWKARGFAF